ncbi:filamentous hemagglutinin N-terminal domain-containing protein [Baaleninema sp.]|uniref:two-partner secretion domain-containing protein n=1 Tax=Baaleninema sp. TaxID=3101197 RepID=UPI003D0624E9
MKTYHGISSLPGRLLRRTGGWVRIIPFSGLLAIASSVVTARSSLTQIVPDTTLPENSRVTVEGNRFTLDGGTEVGNNLFHSFDRFSVSPGSEAFFNNGANIDRIITRVTGGEISNIDGILSANGTASLFLLNPNGIQFGENASLQLGGSFFASTADSLLFADGNQFSAANPQAGTLLTVNVPVGLQFGSDPGAISNRSQANNPNALPSLDPRLPLPETAGLGVVPGQFLGLFGGDITLDGGNLTAFQGQIHLGSVSGAGVVRFGLTPTGLSFDYSGVSELGSIDLGNGATVTASGLGGGEISVRGETAMLQGGASWRSDTFGEVDGRGISFDGGTLQLSDRAFISSSSFGTGGGGDLTVNANRVDLTGTEPGLVLSQLISGEFDPTDLSDGLYVLSVGRGNAGNARLRVDRLNARNGSTLTTATLTAGPGGDLTVEASEAIYLSNGSLLLSGTAGLGDAGHIDLKARSLRVLGGSFVSTSPSDRSQGEGGNLRVRADTIELRSTPAGVPLPGGLFTTTLGPGSSGDITIETRQLQAIDGMQVSAASSSAGQGGNLSLTATESIELAGSSVDRIWLSGVFTTSSLLEVLGQTGTAGAGFLQIDTQRLSLRDGARVSAATGGDGAAGNLIINATESIHVEGSVFSGLGRLEPSALFSESRGAGDAGVLRLNTGRLTLRDGGEVAVRGRGTGAAGNLEVNAVEVDLGSNTAIGASNRDGAGGNIVLKVDRLTVRNGAEISVSSEGSGDAGDAILSGGSFTLEGGTVTATSLLGRGGNVNLQVSDTLVLVDRSQITTQAGTAATGGGDGGNIALSASAVALLDSSRINANAFEGAGGNIQISTQGLFLAPDSQITASSQFGIDGTVTIQTPDIDAGTGLVDLPEDPIDPSQQVARGCAASQGNRFVITGRGGVPENPTETLRNTATWGDLRDWRQLTEDELGFVPQNSQSVNTKSRESPQPDPPLIEATTWVRLDDDSVQLIAPLPGESGALSNAVTHCVPQTP